MVRQIDAKDPMLPLEFQIQVLHRVLAALLTATGDLLLRTRAIPKPKHNAQDPGNEQPGAQPKCGPSLCQGPHCRPLHRQVPRKGKRQQARSLPQRKDYHLPPSQERQELEETEGKGKGHPLGGGGTVRCRTGRKRQRPRGQRHQKAVHLARLHHHPALCHQQRRPQNHWQFPRNLERKHPPRSLRGIFLHLEDSPALRNPGLQRFRPPEATRQSRHPKQLPDRLGVPPSHRPSNAPFRDLQNTALLLQIHRPEDGEQAAGPRHPPRLLRLPLAEEKALQLLSRDTAHPLEADRTLLCQMAAQVHLRIRGNLRRIHAAKGHQPRGRGNQAQ